MTFTKSSIPCDIPFGLYTVNHEYINSLRESDKNVIDPNVTSVYCGPVYIADCKRGVFGFYVPVNVVEYKMNKTFVTAFVDGIYANIFDFSKMIPVVNKCFLIKYDNNNLSLFCEKTKVELEICADAAINAQLNGTGYPVLAF